MKEGRAAERDVAFKDLDEARASYKEGMTELVMGERTKYRDMIEARKDKEISLLELSRQEKPDVNALKGAIEQAEAVQVKPTYI